MNPAPQHTTSSREYPPAAGPRVERLTTLAELSALREPWLELWGRCSSATPFQHPAWLLAWCRTFAPEVLHVLTLWDSGLLVGLAPFLTYSKDGQRVLGLLGGGVSDYLDILLDEQHAQTGILAFFSALEAHQEQFDVCCFEQLRADSALLSGARLSGCADVREVQEWCPVLHLPECVQDLQLLSSARLLHNLRYARRRATRLGPLRLTLASEQAELEVALGLLTRLHAARWQRRGEPGVLVEEAVQRFHREAAPGLLAAGILKLYTLYVAEQPIAALYALASQARVYYYLSGFQPDFERISPGVLVLGEAIEAAIREGAREFDFLRGREAYKYAWGARDRAIYRRTLSALRTP